jgi:hypothetical protein
LKLPIITESRSNTIDPTEVDQEIEHGVVAVRKGIEYADLDIGVTGQRRQRGVPTGNIHVIYQQAYPYAPVRGQQQVFGEDAPGFVGLPDVVLHIEGVLGQPGHGNPRGKCISAIPDDGKTGFARVFGGFLGKAFAYSGRFILLEGCRGGARVIGWQAGAAGECGEYQGQRGLPQPGPAPRSGFRRLRGASSPAVVLC